MTVTLTVVTYQRSSSWLTHVIQVIIRLSMLFLISVAQRWRSPTRSFGSALRPQDVGVAFKIRSDWLTSNGFQIRLHSSRSGDIYARGPRTPTPRNNLHNPRKRLACGLPYSPYSSYRSRWRHYIGNIFKRDNQYFYYHYQSRFIEHYTTYVSRQCYVISY